MNYTDIDSHEVLLANGVDNNPIKIPNGAAVSQAIDLRGFALKAIIAPAAWTAAALSLKASFDGTTFFPWGAVATGAESALLSAVVGGNYVQPPPPSGPPLFPLPRFIKLVSGTNGTPVNQGSDRLFSLVLVPLGLGT